MDTLATILWVLGVWIGLYLIVRLVINLKNRSVESPYYSDYYGR